MYDNYVSDPDDSTTPLSGSDQGLTITSTPRARSCIQRAQNAPTAFDHAPTANSDKLSFQESRPLTPSEGEENAAAKDYLPEREVFMVRIAEIKDTEAETLALIDLDDYYINDDKYLPDAPNQSINVEGERSRLP